MAVGIQAKVTLIQGSQLIVSMDKQQVQEHLLDKETRVQPGTMFSMLVVTNAGTDFGFRFGIVTLVQMIGSPPASMSPLPHSVGSHHVVTLSTLLEEQVQLHLIYSTIVVHQEDAN